MDIIGVPQGTRLVRIERHADARTWIIWTARSPCGLFGSYLILHDDGMVENVTARPDEGDDQFIVKPKDKR